MYDLLHLVKDETEAEKTSYLQMVAKAAGPDVKVCVGEASIFVSYAWCALPRRVAFIIHVIKDAAAV